MNKLYSFQIAYAISTSYGLCGDSTCDKTCSLNFDAMQNFTKAFAQIQLSEEESRLLEKFYKWRELAENETEDQDFLDVFRFFYNNPHWPMFQKMVRGAERRISEGNDSPILKKWFGRYQPLTIDGTILKASWLLSENKNDGIEFIRNFWIRRNIELESAQKFRKKFQNEILEQTDALRARRLLKSANMSEFFEMQRLSPFESVKKYVESVRVKFNKNAKDISGIDADNPSLRLEYANKFINGNDYESAFLILSKTNAREEELANAFYKIRQNVASKLLRNGNAQKAYKVLSMHKLLPGAKSQNENYVKAEWFLGFVASRFMNQTRRGIDHFKNSYENSKDSRYKSKAAFWLGEAQMTGDTAEALRWYEKASLVYNTFYGTMATLRLTKIAQSRFLETHGDSPNNTILTADDVLRFENRELVRVLRILQKAEIKVKASTLMLIFKQLIDDIDDPNEEALLLTLTQTAEEIDFLMMEESKRQKYLENRSGLGGLTQSEIDYVKNVQSANCFIALVHALIQAESRFNRQAQSHVGAQGLMQVMPATAKDEMKKIPSKLLTKPLELHDSKTNLIIGASFLSRLLKKYNGNLIYTLSAYNAGEGFASNFKDSLKKIKVNLTPIDIIELIPYKETRMYVKHVINNFFKYQQSFGAAECYNIEDIVNLR